MHIVRGELLKRQRTLADISREYGCSQIMVRKLLEGYTTSKPLTDYINNILLQPVEELASLYTK